MSKIALIIKREYTTRVMKKSFVILTFLTPILFAAMIVVPLWLANIKDNAKKRIVVIDNSHLYKEVLLDNEVYAFEFPAETVEQVKKQNLNNEDFAALLVIDKDLQNQPRSAVLYSNKQVNLELKSYVESLLRKKVEEQKLASYNIPNLMNIIQGAKVDVDIKTVKWGDDGSEKVGSSGLALAIGLISATLIYLFIVMYGAQVMNGVVQEKTSRIVEVIISSVRPFELMMGKIVGIALVGLTQFLLWLMLTGVITQMVLLVVGSNLDLTAMSQLNTLPGQSNVVAGQASQQDVLEYLSILSGIDFFQIIGLFVLYFLGGYLLYASLFAAVGSAVDSETDTQQFSLPLTLPIVFAIYAAIYSAQNPDGPLAFWCSMIPFTSPIVMMVRLPFGVPFWEIAVSITVLILSFVASTWLAGKIYRTGILMYGKKVTWIELWKWIKY